MLGEAIDHDRVASLCIQTYNTLPSKGAKPGRRSNHVLEWTILAGIVISIPRVSTPAPAPATEALPAAPALSSRTGSYRDYHLISLATGLKCSPYSSLPLTGDVLHDTHAEVLSRRGARIWLLKRLRHEVLLSNQVSEPCQVETKIFEQVEQGSSQPGRWKLRSDIQLHLYVSTLPCGDASSRYLEFVRSAQDAKQQRPGVPSPDDLLQVYSGLPTLLQGTEREATASPPSSPVKSSVGVSRGRASLYTNHNIDANTMPAAGHLRTKPGRPDSPPSISMSCSDKLALWSQVGIQGSLLSGLLEPIRIHSLTISEQPLYEIFSPTQPFSSLRATSPQEQGVHRTQALAAVASNDSLERLKALLISECQRSLSRGSPSLHKHGDLIEVAFTNCQFPHSRESTSERAKLESDSTQDAFREPVSAAGSILYVSAVDYKLGSNSDEQVCLGHSIYENLVNGTKLGAPTKRKFRNDALRQSARSATCKLEWFKLFVDTTEELGLKQRTLAESDADAKRHGSCYRDWKRGQEAPDSIQQGITLYRESKARLVGTDEDAETKIERFLQDKNTAIGGTIQGDTVTAKEGDQENTRPTATSDQGRVELSARKQEGSEDQPFRSWLTTPSKYEMFDVLGRLVEM